MTSTFFSRPTRFFGSRAVLILCIVFFLVPFALRGARMAVERMENNIKDWLPKEFPETRDLEWFGQHFVGERFVLVTWPGCTAVEPRFDLLVKKLRSEVQTDDVADYGAPPDAEPDSPAYRQAAERLRARQVGDRLGLFATGEYHENWGGRGEKWLLGLKDQWYYITPDGELYRWSGKANIPSAVARVVQRLVSGSNTAEGELITTLGDPTTPEQPNEFHNDPRRLTARLFKTITTGPDVLAELSQPGGAMWRRGGDIAEEDRPRIARQDALARLSGTLFGPAFQPRFTWTAEDFLRALPAPSRAALPEDWEARLDRFVEKLVERRYGGDREALVNAPTLDQMAHWESLFGRLGITAPEFRPRFAWTAAAFRDLLSPEKLAELPEDWEATFTRYVERLVEKQYGGDHQALVHAPSLEQSSHWDALFFRFRVEPPPRQTCLIVTLSESGKRDPRRVIGRAIMGKPLGKLLDLAQNECGISHADLKLGGPPVDNVAIDEEGSITLFRLIFWAGLLGVVLSFLCFRSVVITIMVFFVGGVSAVASLSIVWWTGASVDAILMSMPSLVYVLGLSGAVHIVNYYREAAHRDGLVGAPERALAHGWGPCTLAAFTTALGLISLYASNIMPIKRFGLYSALGVMATLALLFTYLPSALQIWPPGYHRRREGARAGGGAGIAAAVEAFWVAVGRWVIHRHALVATVSILIMIVFGLGLRKINTSVQLLKLFDRNAKIISDYRWLEANFGKLVPMELVLRFPTEARMDVQTADPQQQRQQYNFLERMEAVHRVAQVVERLFGEAGADVVGQAVSAATFAPELPSPINRLRGTYNQELAESRDRFLEEDYLSVDEATDEELWRVSLRLGALNNVDYGEFVHEIKRGVEPVLAAYQTRDELMSALPQAGADELPPHATIMILGPAPVVGQADAAEGDDEAAAVEQVAVQAGPQARRHVVSGADQTQIFTETLYNLLVVEGFRLGGRKDRLLWHDPHRVPVGDISEENWQARLEACDIVVLAGHHPDYDLDFIRAHAAKFVDASGHQFDPDTSQTAVQRGAPLDVVYTGVVPVVYKAQRTLLDSLIVSIGLAFVMIALVMMVLLRDWAAPVGLGNGINVSGGLLSMIPNVFPVVVIFGAMGHLRVLIDIGTMMTASVAMGVAVDDTIHFLTWFRKGIRDGLERREAIIQAYRRVATAMTQTTLIGGLGLSVFALSTFTPTQQFGLMMVTLLAAALVGDLILLPAILAGPLGRFFCPSASERAGDAAPASAADASDADPEQARPEAEESQAAAADAAAPLPAVPATGQTPHSRGSAGDGAAARLRTDAPHGLPRH